MVGSLGVCTERGISSQGTWRSPEGKRDVEVRDKKESKGHCPESGDQERNVLGEVYS